MRAAKKLAAFRVKIGYPDKWKDYSTLEIDPTLSYWGEYPACQRMGDPRCACQNG